VVEPPLVDAYERFMQKHHIPDVYKTRCFREVVFERAGSGQYRVRYQAASQADVDRYLREHAARLREDVAAHFPSGLQLSREVWTELQRWG
jgi:hypothetical protein